MTAQTTQRNYYLETQISGVIVGLAVMEGLIWYVHFIIRKRKVGRGGGRTFKIRGAELWNRIPLDMRKKNTAGQFKNALKKYF